MIESSSLGFICTKNAFGQKFLTGSLTVASETKLSGTTFGEAQRDIARDIHQIVYGDLIQSLENARSVSLNRTQNSYFRNQIEVTFEAVLKFRQVDLSVSFSTAATDEAIVAVGQFCLFNQVVVNYENPDKALKFAKLHLRDDFQYFLFGDLLKSIPIACGMSYHCDPIYFAEIGEAWKPVFERIRIPQSPGELAEFHID